MNKKNDKSEISEQYCSEETDLKHTFEASEIDKKTFVRINKTEKKHTKEKLNSDPETLVDYLSIGFQIVKKRYISYLLLVFISCLGVIGGAYGKKPKYESTASLLFKPGASNVSISMSDVKKDTVTIHTEEIITTQAEVIKTRAIIETLVDELGVNFFDLPEKPSDKWWKIQLKKISGYVNQAKESINKSLIKFQLISDSTPKQDMITKIEKNLDTHPLRKSQIITLAFQSKSAEKSKVLLETLIKIYSNSYSELQTSFQALDTYVDEFNKIEQKLTQAEKKLALFQIENKIINYKAEKDNLMTKMDGMKLSDNHKYTLRFNQLIDIGPEYNRLQREVKVLSDAHSVYSKAVQDRKLDKQTQAQVVFHVIDPPTLASSPTSSRLKVISMGLIGSIFVSAFLVFGLEWIFRCAIKSKN